LLRRDGLLIRDFRAAEAVKAAEDAIAEPGQLYNMEPEEENNKERLSGDCIMLLCFLVFSCVV